MQKISAKVSQLTMIPGFILLAFLISVLFASCTSNGNGGKSDLMIGVAEVNYTPEVGFDLEGNYRGDDYASRGIHDSLFARAIVAKGANGNKAALLTVDICLLKKAAVEYMRNYIALKTDIKPGNVMISATHTHSGPKSNIENPKVKEFLAKAAGAVILANEKLKPSALSVGRSSEDRISHNRRIKCIDGTTHMCWEKFPPGFAVGPLGPKDPEVITVSFKQDRKELGSVVNFGCHATTLTGNNWLYSADYPGYMVEAIRKVRGKDFMPLFFNGCCGNVTQVDYRVGFPDTYQECQRIGYLLGVSALEALKNEQPVQGSKVAVSREMVPLKHITITEEQLEWAKKLKQKIDKEGMPPIQADGIPDAEYALQWLDMYKTQNDIDSLEVMVVRVGNVAFVGLPGEIFAEFGMDIKARSAFKNTLVMGLTNDDRDYFPTKVSFTQGPKGFTPMITGYETTPGTTMYEPRAGEELVESAIRQLKRVLVNSE